MFHHLISRVRECHARAVVAAVVDAPVKQTSLPETLRKHKHMFQLQLLVVLTQQAVDSSSVVDVVFRIRGLVLGLLGRVACGNREPPAAAVMDSGMLHASTSLLDQFMCE